MRCELVRPRADLADGFRAARAEWGPGRHEDGFGIGPDDDPDSPAGFAAWLARAEVGPGLRWWIVEDGDVLGGIALRPFDDENTRRQGHIGYGLRPSARGRGLATWALGRVLDEARALGRSDVRVVCGRANAASAAVIERSGGVLEPDDPDPPVRRYRIEL